jgi:hypothetical protein
LDSGDVKKTKSIGMFLHFLHVHLFHPLINILK